MLPEAAGRGQQKGSKREAKRSQMQSSLASLIVAVFKRNFVEYT